MSASKKSRRSSHRDGEDDGGEARRRSSKRDRRSKDEETNDPTLSEVAIQAAAEDKKRAATEKEANDCIAEEKRIERVKELAAMQKRYERSAPASEIQYKGRGAMKAPRRDGSGGGMRGWN